MKSKVATGVLAFFVGVFGVHRFYLGEVGKGILYAIFFWFPLTWLIAFIDGIIFLTMDDDDFNYKYNPHLYRHRRQANNVNINVNTQGQTSTNQNRRRDDVYQKQRPQRHRQQSSKRKVENKSNPFKVEGTKLYRDYDFRGAIQSYLKSLKIQAHDPQINFNLACLYSLEENTQAAFMHLQRAVEQGYSNFDKVRTHDHLAYLRTQPQFESFVKNGYALTRRLAEKTPKMMELTDDVIAKLERLANLREKGILTEEEFQMQKSKLLR
ncbi:MAG: NINE protein [Saprospiraceae bacterium]